MKSIWSRLTGNAIVRFCFSHMLILLLVTLSCFAGFQSAFRIVQKIIMEENSHFLSEGSDTMDDYLHFTYLKGLRLAQADSLRQLERMTALSDGYYTAVRNALKDFAAQGQYDDTDFTANTFIYLDNLDRLLYDSAVYRKGVFFQAHGAAFGLTEAELQAIWENEKIVPWFYVSASQDLFYVFPCFMGLQSSAPSGTIVTRVQASRLIQGMTFRQRFSGSSLFLFEGDRLLIADDGLACCAAVPDEWKQTEGVWPLGDNLVFVHRSGKYQELSYMLVIPQQEALAQLHRLQWRIILLLVLIVSVGTGIALAFSMRSGKPINHIADMLEEDDDQCTGRDLDSIHTSIEKMIEDKQNSRPALQKAFFHSLLKADFISKAEMEYTARKAGVQLSGDRYYAAQIRFFPQMDMEELGGETVDEVRNLQKAAADYMAGRFPGAVWMYKRNALMTLYLIEARDEEALVDELANLVLRMRSEYHADCCWGIGSPCTDLMYFWKSAEEANEAVAAGDQQSICFYAEMKARDRTCYLPYSVEEHLIQSLRTGDEAAARQTMDIIRHENVDIRAINRKQFLTLNRRITDILAQVLKELREPEQALVELSVRIPSSPEQEEAYFAFADTVIQDICKKTVTRKSRRRNEKIRAILGFMEENYADPGMGLAMVSDRFKWSEGYLSSLFKEEMGLNFAEYLERLRIDQACALLKEGVLVSLIAEKTGYNSVQSFRRAFKRVKGVSPSEYREG